MIAQTLCFTHNARATFTPPHGRALHTHRVLSSRFTPPQMEAELGAFLAQQLARFCTTLTDDEVGPLPLSSVSLSPPSPTTRCCGR